MELNSNLPVLVTAVIAVVGVSIAGALALAPGGQPQFRRLVLRLWLAAVIVILGGVAVFWIATAMVEGPRRATIDHSLQDHQQQELRQRLQKGGH